MTKNLEEHEEPKKVIHALKNPIWIEAMQEALLQFKLQEVWTLVELPRLKRKLCLSTPGFEDPGTSLQEYTKVEKGFMDASISQSLMSSMGELTFFLGLQVKQKEDGIFISQDKYVTEILKKFGFTNVKTASTPMETQKLLLKDEDGEEVDVKTVNGEVQLQALVDGKKIIVTEASVRRDLQLNDEEGTDCLPNATIFEELTRMGYEKLSQKLTFYKAFFSPQWKFLIHTILQCLSAKTTAWNEFSRIGFCIIG
ncbi:putative ribonuclease H-like domain-containing protein [Tanacetum coccineum]